MLSIDLKEYNRIEVIECINYALYPTLENKIRTTVNSYIKKGVDIKNLSENELYDFLMYVLLRVGNSNEWIETSSKYQLTQRYLYIVIRKHVLLHTN